MITISQLLSESTKRLRENKILSPRLDVEILLAHELNVDRTYLLINSENKINESTVSNFEELVNRRLEGEPIAYITGHQEFMGLDFRVNHHVLIPRPDTEILVEYVINIVKSNNDRVTLLDIGTGSGAIALSIGKYCPNSTLTLLDISEEALNVARENSNILGIADQADYLLSDCFNELKKQKYDIIVSNPPYIPTLDIEGLQTEVRVFEPRGALDGGIDGLLFYKRIVEGAKKYLKGDGLIALEIGYNQGQDVMNLLKENGYCEIKIMKDYGNHDRVVVARNGLFP